MQLLLALHQDHNFSYKSPGRSWDDCDTHYVDVYEFISSRLSKNGERFDPIKTYFMEMKSSSVGGVDTSRQAWGEEETRALFFKDKSRNKAESVHYYHVIASLYRMGGKSTRDGIFEAVDEFYKANIARRSENSGKRKERAS